MEIWEGECDFCHVLEICNRRIVQATNDGMASICGECVAKAAKLLLESKR